MHLDVATGGELHVALAAGVPGRPARAARQQQVDGRAAPGPARSASAASSSTASTSSTASRRLRRRGRPPPAGAGAGHPGRRGPHPRVRAHRPGRLEVRLRRCRPGTAARGGGAGPVRSPAVDLVGLHAAHRQPGVRVGRLLRQAVEVVAPFVRDARACPSCRSAAGSAWPTSRARRRPSITEWGAAIVRRCLRDAGITARGGGRAGSGHRRRGRRHPLHGGHHQGHARRPHLRRRRRRHERQPPAGALRQRLRDVPAPGRRRRRPRDADPARRQALRVGRPAGAGGARCPADLAVGDVLATPVTGAYGHSMGSNYNKVPRPAVVFVADGDGPPGRAPGDRRRPPPPPTSAERRSQVSWPPGVPR